jgi:hypothetical protein
VRRSTRGPKPVARLSPHWHRGEEEEGVEEEGDEYEEEVGFTL